MKSTRTICLRSVFIVGAALLCNFAVAGVSAAGVVTVTVANAKTRQFLNQAEVRIHDTVISTTTDSDGYPSGVPAGAQKIVVTYVGLESPTAVVEVTPGTAVRSNFELKSDTYVMDEFVVCDRTRGPGRCPEPAKQQPLPSIRIGRPHRHIQRRKRARLELGACRRRRNTAK